MMILRLYASDHGFSSVTVTRPSSMRSVLNGHGICKCVFFMNFSIVHLLAKGAGLVSGHVKASARYWQEEYKIMRVSYKLMNKKAREKKCVRIIVPNLLERVSKNFEIFESFVQK